MRRSWFLLFAAGCGGQTGEMDLTGKRETVETPLALDEVSLLGFTAQDVLDRAPTTTYDGGLIAGDPDFGPGSLSELLLQAAPFTITALTDPEAVFRQEYLDGGILYESVAVGGQITVVSADYAFALAGGVELVATAPNDADIGWAGVGTGLTGTMPAWVDEAVAETANAWSADGSCAPEDPFALVRPHEALATPALILNIVLEPCGSGNYAWIELTPAE
ncbi:MAG: hypothetical protein Q8P41_13045 [Pseudomonadota bacterium]|nr:hypothetical protein [Pseudomonadota bacterium]